MIRSVFQFSLTLLGDGTSTEFSFDITKGPVNLDLGGNNPTGVQVGGTGVVNGTLKGTIVTVTFDNATNVGSINVVLYFPGVG